MIRQPLEITGRHISGLNPDGTTAVVRLAFTPKKCRLTKATQTAIVAAGFHHAVFGTWMPDPDLLRAFLQFIRDESLAQKERA